MQYLVLQKEKEKFSLSYPITKERWIGFMSGQPMTMALTGLLAIDLWYSKMELWNFAGAFLSKWVFEVEMNMMVKTSNTLLSAMSYSTMNQWIQWSFTLSICCPPRLLLHRSHRNSSYDDSLAHPLISINTRVRNIKWRLSFKPKQAKVFDLTYLINYLCLFSFRIFNFPVYDIKLAKPDKGRRNSSNLWEPKMGATRISQPCLPCSRHDVCIAHETRKKRKERMFDGVPCCSDSDASVRCTLWSMHAVVWSNPVCPSCPHQSTDAE